MTATLDRNDALSHEDRQFLSWEHPLLSGAMEQVINQDTGNSGAITVKHPQLKPGQLLLESLFVVECVAPKRLHAGRFLPKTLIRTLLNLKGKRFDGEIGCDELLVNAQPLEAQQVASIIGQYRKPIQQMLRMAESNAQAVLPEVVNKALAEMMSLYAAEIARMTALKKHNPSVREEEIRLIKQEGADLHTHLQGARLRLDAVRLVVTL